MPIRNRAIKFRVGNPKESGVPAHPQVRYRLALPRRKCRGFVSDGGSARWMIADNGTIPKWTRAAADRYRR